MEPWSRSTASGVSRWARTVSSSSPRASTTRRTVCSAPSPPTEDGSLARVEGAGPARLPTPGGDRSGAGGLFVEPELVTDRIQEGGESAHSGSDVGPRRQDLAAPSFDLLQRRPNVVDHDVHPGTLVRRP